MGRTRFGMAWAALLGALAFTDVAAAQGFGGPQYPQGQYPQGQYPQGQDPQGQDLQGQPGGQYGQPSAGLSVGGTWSGQTPGQGGMSQMSEYDGPDGSFVSVLRLPNGSMQRTWGHYRATQVSDSQMQVQFAVEGWLPREICTQIPGFQMQCGPYNIPTSGAGTVTFVSPNAFVANGVTMSRDPSPYLLQQQVPERLVQYGQAPAQPNIPQPVVPGGSRYVPLNRPTGQQCDDLQQQRLCAINNGHYERSGGCLVCVPP